MAKKVISVLLVIITICSTLAITASAASYSTGNYAISASNGSNVRTGAGTSYSKVGAASKGTTFAVTKVSGNWGYTSSIKCTGDTLNLGDNYGQYRVYIAKKTYPDSVYIFQSHSNTKYYNLPLLRFHLIFVPCSVAERNGHKYETIMDNRKNLIRIR